MTAEIIPIRPSTKRAEDEKSETLLGRPERLFLIKDQLGFYPHSNDEASRITSLITKQGQFKALAHLNEVYIHQRRAGSDAPATLRLIVHKFDEYAGNALNEGEYMKAFTQQFDYADADSSAHFTEIFPVASWEHDGIMRAAFTAMGRHLETEAFAVRGMHDKLGKRDLIDYTAGDERIERILEALGGCDGASLEALSAAVGQSEEKRLEFWMKQLETSKKHWFVREVATRALENLIDASQQPVNPVS